MNQARPISRASTKIRAKMVCSKLPAELVGVAIAIGGPAGMAGRGAAATTGVLVSGAGAAAASGALALIEAAAVSAVAGVAAGAGAARAMEHAAASGSSTVEINRPGFIYSVFGCARTA